MVSYLNNPSLSDVVLVSEDGQRFFAHRLVLCVQSPVFKTMLDSDLWADSQNKEVCWLVISIHVTAYNNHMTNLPSGAPADCEWACPAALAKVSVHRRMPLPPGRPQLGGGASGCG